MNIIRTLRIVSGVLVLLLSACATTTTTTTNEWSPSADTKRDPRAAQAPRVDLSKQSVSSVMAPSNNLWIHIRQGFQLPELDSPLVLQQTRWLTARPDYLDRSMARSSRYLFYIVEEVNLELKEKIAIEIFN
jgi:membrane-bound lytic murein transglycosylase D